MKRLATAFGRYKNKKKIISYTKQAELLAAKLTYANIDASDASAKMAVAAKEGRDTDALYYCAEIIYYTLGMKPFTTQLIATLAMLDGKFVEMETGEGKTLVFLMVSAINALKGRRIVLATANEYLAERDAAFAKPFFSMLGISSQFVNTTGSIDNKKEAYNADVVYCDLSDLILDYLRSSFAKTPEAKPNISLDMILVDEADHVLIDKGSTPLTISKFKETDRQMLHLAVDTVSKFKVKQHVSKEDDAESYAQYDAVFFQTNNDLVLQDSALAQFEAKLVEAGIISGAEALYHSSNLHLVSLLEQATKGIHAFVKGKDYIVSEQTVIPINRHTGRIKAGQFYSAGLQQAIEVKEGVPLSKESYAFTSMAIQHFIQLYNDVIGMSGTLNEHREEIASSFGSDTIKVPRNNPLQRIDEGDKVYLTEKMKRKKVLREIVQAHKSQQPVLVCAASEKEALAISEQLKSLMIAHRMIANSNQREEAEIIEVAGKPKAITITSGMSGRGTDIVLGGLASSFKNKDDFLKSKDIVVNAGGLLVIQSGKQRLAKQERQTIGRAGRQGDPGRTVTILSMEDDLLKPFNLGRLQQFLLDSGAEEDNPINNNIVNKSIVRAQQLSSESDVKNRRIIASQMGEMEKQRQIIFNMREQWLTADGDEFIAYVEEAFNITIESDEIMAVKEKILDIFDDTYLNYRVKVTELMGNMGLRGLAVSNIGSEIKRTLFKTFTIFIQSFQNEVFEYLEERNQS